MRVGRVGMKGILGGRARGRVSISQVGAGIHHQTKAGLATQSNKKELSFDDAREAYMSKKTSEVARAYLVLSLCGIGPLVKNNEVLMKIGQKILGKALFGRLMKQTFYGHFVAGEDQEKIKPIISRMQSFGVKSILDYSVEEDLANEKEETPVPRKKATEIVNDSKQLAQYTPVDESEHKEVDRKHKLNSARVYFYQGEANCDRNMATFIDCIDAVKGSTGGTGFSAIKLTALGRPEILIRLSECIERTRRYYTQVTGKKGMVIKGKVNRSSFEDIFKEKKIQNPDVEQFLQNMTGDKDGIINLFNWSSLIDGGKDLGDVLQVPNLETGIMEPLITGDDDGALTKSEEKQFRNMVNRLHTIFKYASSQNVRVMIDAEQSYFQPAIHRLAIEMMRTYNTEKAIVFNTYQCYMKKAYKTITLDLEQAKRQNFYFGAKLVRGAYMEQERARAELLGYKDPINPNFEATSEMYHKVLDECLTRIHALKISGDDPQRIGIMVASHNEDTVKYGVRRMAELNLDPQERVLCFAQLLGMCDQISFPLGQAGYSVYKYVPYGPVNEVLPYLSRRANENGQLLSKVEKERNLLRQELARRIVSGQVWYTPQGEIKPVGFQ
jgi:proline dehydrogenase